METEIKNGLRALILQSKQHFNTHECIIGIQALKSYNFNRIN